MTIDELVKAVLVAVVGYLLRLGLGLIGIEIDPVLFNTIVAGIVAYLLGLFGYEIARGIAPRRFRFRAEG